MRISRERQTSKGTEQDLSRGTRKPKIYIEMLTKSRTRVAAGVVSRAALHCGVSRLLQAFMREAAKQADHKRFG